ncbi:hypothetical protein HanRHA438_Chr04g0180771 [Helianthus annuus]|nr:hypothetical protein HanRHA438_Chr04g0180771 [Helianthus annuus]
MINTLSSKVFSSSNAHRKEMIAVGVTVLAVVRSDGEWWLVAGGDSVGCL